MSTAGKTWQVEAAGPEGLSTERSRNKLERVRFSHDAMVDVLLARPGVSNRELATEFGYSETWISRVLCSDAFQARLAQRKDEMVDPVILQNIEERMKGLAVLSTEVLAEKLEAGRNADLAVKVLGLTATALGYGARKEAVSQNNFVVMLPGKTSDSELWAQQARGEPPARGVAADIIDVTPVPSDPAKNSGEN